MDSQADKARLLERFEQLIKEYREIDEAKATVPAGDSDFFRAFEVHQTNLRDLLNEGLAKSASGIPLLDLAGEIFVPEAFWTRVQEVAELAEHDLGALIDFAFPQPVDLSGDNQDTREKRGQLREIAANPEVFVFVAFLRFHSMPGLRIGDAFFDHGYVAYAIATAESYLVDAARVRPRDWMFCKNIQQVIAQRADREGFSAFRKAYAELEFRDLP